LHPEQQQVVAPDLRPSSLSIADIHRIVADLAEKSTLALTLVTIKPRTRLNILESALVERPNSLCKSNHLLG
jgi:hypothetical protein